ncbi:MAG: tetratricopeptide repeat protein [Candidatus Kerfeldbacteria bacterium]|nr:tetratricopeptide repeat protein [Candidatus Kerfeldbacteria bacterium]
MDFTQAVQNVVQAVTPRPARPAARWLERTLLWGLRLMVFLVPLTFLPWTFEMFEFNKQFVLLGLGIVLLVVWLSRVVVLRETSLTKSWLNWAVLAWLLAVSLATAFSIDAVTSILGFYGRFNGGLASTVAYLMLYYLVLQTARDEGQTSWLVGSWLCGVGSSAAILLLQIMGLRWLPFPVAQLPSFSPLGGSLNVVAITLAASLPLALFFAQAAATLIYRSLSLIFSLLVLVVLFIIDYQLGWVGLVVGSVSWLGLIFWKNESVGFKWTMLPALALLLAVVAWPLSTPTLTRLSVPVEVNLSMSSSWKIAWQNVQANPVLGTGPETFIYGFSKYKPDNFNDSNFWAYRFDKASSELAQLLGTTGSLGLAAYLAVIALGLYLSWRLIKDRSGSSWYLRAAVVSSFLVLVVGNIFYFSSTVLASFWWLILGLIASLSSRGERHISLLTSPRASFSFSFGLAVVVLLGLGIWFGLGRFLAADMAYARAQVSSQRLDTLDQANAELVRAVTLNPWRDTYRIGLAQVFLAQANREAASPVGKTDQAKQAQLARLQQYVASSIAAARSATELARENVANWEALGSIYRGSVLFAKDAEPWIIASFEQAVKLEPSNPALYTELGKAYLISANRKRQEASQAQEKDKTRLEAEAASQVARALEQFDLAIKYKANYTPAHFNQVLAYEQQGKLDEAVDKLERMREFNPQDIDVLYELGSLYYTRAQYDKAEEVFGTITSLVPNYANAHFGLALTYQKKSEKDKAVAELERVLQLNPDNKDIKKLIEDIKSGQDNTVQQPAPQPKK